MKDITVKEIAMHKDNLKEAIGYLVSEYVAATGLQPTISTEFIDISSHCGYQKIARLIVTQEL